MPLPSSFLTHSVTVQRKTDGAGDSNRPTGTWSNHLTGVLGRIRKLSGSEVVKYGREQSQSSWIFDTDAGQDITTKDRIQFTDDSTGTATTRTLDIQDVTNPQQMGHHFVVLCDENV